MTGSSDYALLPRSTKHSSANTGAGGACPTPATTNSHHHLGTLGPTTGVPSLPARALLRSEDETGSKGGKKSANGSLLDLALQPASPRVAMDRMALNPNGALALSSPAWSHAVTMKGAGLNNPASSHVANGLNEMTELTVQRAEVTFSLQVWILEFIYNTFNPLATPLCLFMEGRTGARNRGFIGINFGFFFQIVFSTIVCAINVLYFTSLEGSKVYLIEVLLADSLFLVRNCVIATKYSYFPETILEQLRNEYLPFFGREAQIISGWATPTPETIQKELTYAIAR
jgi:hypothetical protein